MIAISHPTGNQNLRNATMAFHKAGKLVKFYTTIAWDRDSLLTKILPPSLSVQLQRREYANIPKHLIDSAPFKESVRLLAKKTGLCFLTHHETGLFSVDTIYSSLDRYVAKQIKNNPNISSIYCYEDGALTSFQIAKNQQIKTIYELPIGYWRAARKIMGEEIERNPEWAGTILSIRDSDKKLARKDEELALADKIIVASQFTADTLKLSPHQNKNITIIPYGGPEPVAQPNLKTKSDKVLRVLFVGGLSQRKGLSYLLDAAEKLKDKINLTIIGSRIGECAERDKALEKYRYIPSLPHHQILQEMDLHDVLVFPSLFEGFGLVILEAMSRGIPVIATPHTAAPDIINDGQDGFIVPIRDSNAIAEKLEQLFNDTDLLNSMKHEALMKSQQYSWSRYQQILVNNVSQ